MPARSLFLTAVRPLQVIVSSGGSTVIGDKYVASTGSNANSGTKLSPYLTIAFGWAQITAGQTLVMLTDITEDISALAAGTAGNYKRLAGETPVKVLTCNTFNAGSTAMYTQYQNIEFNCADQIDFQSATFTKSLMCGFVGGPAGTSVGNVVSHIAGSNQLYESCYFPGTAGRYATLAFQVDNTIYRWCVGRTQANVWGPPGSNPCACFTIYSSTNSAWYQCVATDCLDQGNGSEWLAGFNLVSNVGASTGCEANGCIATDLDTFMPGFQTDGSFSLTATLTNCVSVRGGYGMVGGTHNTGTITISGGEFSSQANDGIANFGPGAVNVSNANTVGNTGSNFNGATSVTGNTTTALNMNARLSAMKQIGVSGTMRGETGWNVAQATDLFPFPNEDIIRTRMALISSRGFCGGAFSLSSYLKR